METQWTSVYQDRFRDETHRQWVRAGRFGGRLEAQKAQRKAQLEQKGLLDERDPKLNKRTYSYLHEQQGFEFGPPYLPVMEVCDVMRLRRESPSGNGDPRTANEEAVLGRMLLKELGRTVSGRSDTRGPRYPARTLVADQQDGVNFFRIRPVRADGKYATTISVFVGWDWATDDSGGEILGACAVHVQGLAPRVFSFPMAVPEEAPAEKDVQISDFQPGKRPASPRQ